MTIKEAQKAYLYDRLILYDGHKYPILYIITWLDMQKKWQHSFALKDNNNVVVVSIKDCEVV